MLTGMESHLALLNLKIKNRKHLKYKSNLRFEGKKVLKLSYLG